MTDLFNIGSSALLSYKRALDTVGHNIANATTPGYSRQSVEFAAREGTGSGGGFFGSGVITLGVSRQRDPFGSDRLISSLSSLGQASAVASIGGSVDRLLSDEATGLGGPLRDFLGAVEALTADPTSATAREVFVSSAQSLAFQFQQMSSGLSDKADELDLRIDATVDEINGLSGEVARLNTQIVQALGEFGGQPPNDLLDRRDELVRQLSARIGVSTVEQDDGALNVFAAGGQALVLGAEVGRLSTGPSRYGAEGGIEVLLAGAGGSVTVTNRLSGGNLGGYLEARRSIIDPAQGELGRLAAAVSTLANAQQAAGVDLLGQTGAPLFTAPQAVELANLNNSGSATLSASLADVGALTGRDYVMRFDGADWELRDTVSGQVVPLGGAGTVADPFAAEGLSLVVGGIPDAGDSFLVRSTATVAADMRVSLPGPAGVAAAAPVIARADTANGGSAAPGLTVVDGANPALTNTVSIAFVSDTSYTVDGAGPFAYSPGTPIAANGWELNLDGIPLAGDEFTVAPTLPDSGDNSNARALLAGLQGGFFDGGATSVQAAHAQLLSRTGASVQRADLQQSAFSAIVERDRSDLESVSGVNLDEEAADLLRFEQAYQAAARIIATADTLFQTVLNAVGRA